MSDAKIHQLTGEEEGSIKGESYKMEPMIDIINLTTTDNHHGDKMMTSRYIHQIEMMINNTLIHHHLEMMMINILILPGMTVSTKIKMIRIILVVKVPMLGKVITIVLRKTMKVPIIGTAGLLGKVKNIRELFQLLTP